MEDFKEIYEKAGVLMQSALKKYAKGDSEGGDKDRKEANRLYDLAQADVNRVSDNMLYGESRNFGIIYKVLESNTSNLCEDKDKRRRFKNVLKMIKEDKTLQNEFKFYDALTNPINAVNPELYVNEAINIKPTIDAVKAKDANCKLINEIRKNNFFEYVDIEDDTLKLFESIEYILFNKPNLKSLNEFTNAKNCIIEHVASKTDAVNNTAETQSIDEALNHMVEKYDAILNEDEKKLIATISESKDKEQLFNYHKNELLEKIDEVAATMTKNESMQLAEVRNDIQNKIYDSNKLLEDISEFIEIKNVLSEKKQ